MFSMILCLAIDSFISKFMPQILGIGKDMKSFVIALFFFSFTLRANGISDLGNEENYLRFHSFYSENIKKNSPWSRTFEIHMTCILGLKFPENCFCFAQFYYLILNVVDKTDTDKKINDFLGVYIYEIYGINVNMTLFWNISRV
jgi:hypothetical protein